MTIRRAATRAIFGARAAAATAATALAFPAPARADGPVRVEIGAVAGWSEPPLPAGAPNALGFGVGARAGVDVGHLYAGVKAQYDFGQRERVAGYPAVASSGGLVPDAASFTEGGRGVECGGELGYNFTFGRFFTLRLRLGAGALIAFDEAPVLEIANPNAPAGRAAPSMLVQGSPTHVSAYAEPGVVVQVSASRWFVGADANTLFLPLYWAPSGLRYTLAYSPRLGAQAGVIFP